MRRHVLAVLCLGAALVLYLIGQKRLSKVGLMHSRGEWSVVEMPNHDTYLMYPTDYDARLTVPEIPANFLHLKQKGTK